MGIERIALAWVKTGSGVAADAGCLLLQIAKQGRPSGWKVGEPGPEGVFVGLVSEIKTAVREADGQ